MGFKIVLAGLCSAAIALSTVVSGPAAAQNPPKKSAVANKQKVAAKPRRIVVQPRSYLDGGTEVLPGDRKFNDYAIPPGYSPLSVIDNTAFSHRSPLPGPFELPGRNNPWNW